jgi:hypothetical protein
LAANQLKVFTSLSMFLEEYRSGDDQSPLLCCAQALVLRRDIMSTEPEPDEDEDDRSATKFFLWAERLDALSVRG